MKNLIAIVLVMFSIFGIVDAGYITYQKFTGQVPPCSINFQCEKVLTSKWSMIGPIPLSLLGFLFYCTFFTFALLYFLDVTLPPQLPLRRALFILGCFGFGFSLFLISLMAFVIHGWCLYCLISATNCTVLFITSTYLWKRQV